MKSRDKRFVKREAPGRGLLRMGRGLLRMGRGLLRMGRLLGAVSVKISYADISVNGSFHVAIH